MQRAEAFGERAGPEPPARLLEGGGAYFAALETACDGARAELHLQAYIFADDVTGRRIAAALARAARRGVAVQVLLDGFGSRAMSPALRSVLVEAGVRLLFFRPEARLPIPRRRRLRRLHHKIAAFDGELAFVGGINVIDDMHTPGHTPPRWDYAVEVGGGAALEVLRLARRTWARAARTYVGALWAQWRQWPVAIPAVANSAGTVRLVVRDTVRHRRDIEEAYLQAIAVARSEVLIASAYFLPGVEFRHALTEAAARGVRVVLLLQARVEYRLMHHASRTLYRRLLAAGIEIHEYRRSFMHAKVAVIDGHWATVGSSNIDPLSLLLAREANVVVEDAAFATTLRASLAQGMSAGATRVEADRLRRGPVARLAGWVSYGIVRLLLGWAGYGGRRDFL
jgi:cardiolipin synthase